MRINICGDLTTTGKGLSAIQQGTAFSDDIINLFKSSDVNIVNLESPVVTDIHNAIKKVGPHLHTTKVTIEYLKKCGVNLVTLANNHFYDYGRHGVETTLTSLKGNNIDYIGGGLTHEEISKIHYAEQKGLKIAILNFCESEFSVNDGIGSNPIEPINVYKSIQIAKQNSNYIIVICHGGHEGYQLPSPRMKKLYHFFIEAGANIVCNHHQHCFSGWEEYNGGKIYYGLGNFFFDDHRPQRQRSSKWNYGYIVSLDIQKNEIKDYILPYKQCINETRTSLLINISTEEKKFQTILKDLSQIIKNDATLSASFEEWCKKQNNNMRTWFSPYTNRILMALCRRKLLPAFINKKKKLQLLNLMRCESHQDIAIAFLKQK